MTAATADLVYWISIAAVAVCAVTGVLEAEGKRIDLIGVLIIGMVAALGGGSLRDLLLNRPVFWIANQTYLLCALAASFSAFVVAHRVRIPTNLFLLPDALGLALFTISGTKIALALGTPWLAASFMGVITGVFGGVLRDVLANEVPLIMRPGTWYATAAWLGALSLIALRAWGMEEIWAALIAGGVTFLSRLAAILFNLTLPVFSSKK